MGCIIALIALITPRLVMVLICLFSDWFTRAYESALWPFIGFLFMPYTTLAYMTAMLNNHHQVSGGWLVLLIAAVVIDIGNWGGSHHSARRKQ
jgi:hypothetical protein